MSNQDEQRLLSTVGLTEPSFHTLLWTAKEAMSKVLQTGFTASTDIFEISKFSEVEGGGYIVGYRFFPQFSAVSLLGGENALSLTIPTKLLNSESRNVLPMLIGLLRDTIQPM